MLNQPVPIPRWGRPLDALPGALVRDGGDYLEFRARGFEGDAEVAFAPYFRLTHERYNLYWRRSVA
jgi:hypothetical protein